MSPTLRQGTRFNSGVVLLYVFKHVNIRLNRWTGLSSLLELIGCPCLHSVGSHMVWGPTWGSHGWHMGVNWAPRETYYITLSNMSHVGQGKKGRTQNFRQKNILRLNFYVASDLHSQRCMQLSSWFQKLLISRVLLSFTRLPSPPGSKRYAWIVPKTDPQPCRSHSEEADATFRKGND